METWRKQVVAGYLAYHAVPTKVIAPKAKVQLHELLLVPIERLDA